MSRAVISTALVATAAMFLGIEFQASAQDTQLKTADPRVAITVAATNDDQQGMLNVFETFLRAVIAQNFTKAHDLLDPDVATKITAEAVRDRYQLLEAEFGPLRRFESRGVWYSKSPDHMAVVVVTHEYESKRVLFAYTLRSGAKGWRVVGFEEGGKTPAGTFKDRQP